MTIYFSNSSPKIAKSGIFGPKFRHFFFVKFCKQTNLRVLISERKIVFLFQIVPQKYPNKAFLSQVQALSLFRKILLLEKLEDADFKYDNIFFKFQSKNSQMRNFWSKTQEFLLMVLISHMTMLFSNSSPKTTKLGIFGLKFRHFRFFMKLCK